MKRAWPRYPTVWRWHFYAGLFCIPFILWLSLTGGVYLFKPQIEAWLDRPYAAVAQPGPRAGPVAEVAAALEAVPGGTLSQYELPATPTQAVQVLVSDGDLTQRVYVDPATLTVLKVGREDRRPMKILSRLHGELLAGPVGSYVVELAASWAIVMLVSGLFLWWPHGQGFAGVVYPRLRAGSRRFWRDLHAVTGFWVSAAALFLLVSGLPWAASWGAYLKMARQVAEGQPVKQDWSSSHTGHDGMADMAGMTMPRRAPVSLEPLDGIVRTIGPLDLAAPVLIAPPAQAGQPWTAKSNAANRPLRTDLTLDASGAVLTRQDFARRPLVDRLVGWGVAIHEGQAFGWINLLVNLVTALMLMLLSISSVALWWRRRTPGTLGAPRAAVRPALAWSFAAMVAAMAVMLPLFGASLLLVLLIDRILPARPRAWLGLEAT